MGRKNLGNIFYYYNLNIHIPNAFCWYVFHLRIFFHPTKPRAALYKIINKQIHCSKSSCMAYILFFAFVFVNKALITLFLSGLYHVNCVHWDCVCLLAFSRYSCFFARFCRAYSFVCQNYSWIMNLDKHKFKALKDKWNIYRNAEYNPTKNSINRASVAKMCAR